ncbi:hypothetical protein MKX03_007865 [Papaver bracteatum]|nr:hypothetical protein MKX03_007865 [Papaver bracteatum]
MVLNADDLAKQWKEDPRGIDLDAIMQSYFDGYDDYAGEIFYSDDEDEMSMMSVETKKESDISGTRMDTHSNFYQHIGGNNLNLLLFI